MYPDILNPVELIDHTFLFIIGADLVILLGITLFMLYCVFRFHHSRHPEPDSTDYNLTLEIAWTVIPTILVMAMFYYGWSGFRAMRTVPPNALPIKVTGKMWSWQFEYENGKIHDEMVVPQGRPIKAIISSHDVLHSFYIPAFRLKMDAVPGMETIAWFIPERVGSFTIYCAEFCGDQHSSMISQVQVLSAEAYAAWLNTREQKFSGIEEGKRLTRVHGCLVCHSLDGSLMVGPGFKGLFGKETAVLKAGNELCIKEDEAHLLSSILDPEADIVKGFDPNMPKSEGLSADDAAKIVEFIKFLK